MTKNGSFPVTLHILHQGFWLVFYTYVHEKGSSHKMCIIPFLFPSVLWGNMPKKVFYFLPVHAIIGAVFLSL